MDCSACGHANPEDARFCGGCAASLEVVPTCTACGRENAPGQKFCNACAEPLTAAVSAGASESSRSAAGAGKPARPLPGPVGGGRYLIEGFLGEGARKRVYLAHDTRLDCKVALALVKSEGLDAEGRIRVRREAQAMGRLRDSPRRSQTGPLNRLL